MDRGSRLFYTLEKRRGAKKHVICLLAEDDTLSWICTDCKVAAKAISLRLGSMLADVGYPDQIYTVPGRSIFDNLYLVRDLLEFGCRDGLSFTLLSLDQEKAFDRVDPGYLLSTLQAFGFRLQFVGFLWVLYASAECLVRLNWTLTKLVSFGRLTGLVLREPELQLVLSAYANNVLLVVQDLGDLARVEACQAIYSAASSAWVNWVKSSGLVVRDSWQLLFCTSNEIQPFFCDLPPLLALSCSNTSANEAVIFVGGLSTGLSSFLLVLISYGHIFLAVIKIHSVSGRHKAFSTCGWHLAVFILFFDTLSCVYM
ncbi:unnamed protein product [Caretta caretta]